jgi:hypothetical protein
VYAPEWSPEKKRGRKGANPLGLGSFIRPWGWGQRWRRMNEYLNSAAPTSPPSR